MGPKLFSRKLLAHKACGGAFMGWMLLFFSWRAASPGPMQSGPSQNSLLSSWSLAGRARYHSRISFQVASAVWWAIGLWSSTNDHNVYELRSYSPVLNSTMYAESVFYLHGAHGGNMILGRLGSLIALDCH